MDVSLEESRTIRIQGNWTRNFFNGSQKWKVKEDLKASGSYAWINAVDFGVQKSNFDWSSSMAVLVKTCCCGCSLRSRVVILGIIGLVSSSCYQSSNHLKYPSAFHTLVIAWVIVVLNWTIFAISRTLVPRREILRAKINHVEFVKSLIFAGRLLIKKSQTEHRSLKNCA